MKRRKKNYFSTGADEPEALRFRVTHRARFSEVDAMAIVWHGRYLQFFEIAAEELNRRIGLSYLDYRNANLRAPLVQVHVDFHSPVLLGEEVVIEARLIWTEAARLNTEYTVTSQQGMDKATGYSVQMFTDGQTGEPLLVTPPLVAACRARWRNGDFSRL